MSGPPLSQTVSSEWIKFKTVRSTVWTLLVTFILCVGLGALISFGRSHSQRSLGGISSTGKTIIFDPTRVSLNGFFLAEISIGVIGILVISSEYATGSIRSTFAATPRRLPVLLAKAIVVFFASLALGELCSFVSFFIGQAILKAQNASSATLSTPGALRGVLLAGLSLALLALFAMGIGAMLRHTAGSITVYVAILLVSFLLLAALPTDWQHHVSKFLPEVLTSSMRAASANTQFSSYSALTSTLILICYAIASLVGGAVLMARRDA